MLVRDQLHLFFLPWVVVGAVACTTEARTPIVSDAVDTTAVAVTEGEVKAGWADKAYVGMTRGEFLKAYATDVIKEQSAWDYGFDGPESMGILVEKDGKPWVYVCPLTFNYGVEQSPNDTIDFIIVLSPNIQLHAGFKVGMTVGELATICPGLELWVGEMDGVETGYCPSVPKYSFEFDAPANGLIGKYRQRATPREDGTTEEYVGIALPSTPIRSIMLHNF
jgi:hypothetical protein